MRVGLLGMYRSANLGDTAIQDAVMRALRERLGSVEFVGICAEPEDTARTHGIAAAEWWGHGPFVDAAGGVTWPRSNGSSLGGRAGRWIERLGRFSAIDRVAGTLDVLIVSGSGQIDDFWGGPWAQPFRMLLWTAAARRRRLPIAVVGVGLDELHTALGKRFCLAALGLASFRAFRDAGTLESLRTMGLRSPSLVCPDPALGLRAESDAGPDETSPYVAVSPISRQAWPGDEDADYAGYLTSLARLSERLLEGGVGVRFLCSQSRMDPPVADRILRDMRAGAADRCTVERVSTVDDFLRVASGARAVVASRLHAVILGLVAHSPVVAISYSRKVRAVMHEAELDDYCVDLRDANDARLHALVTRAFDPRVGLRTLVASRHEAMRRSLDSTYDELARTLRIAKSR